MEKLITFAVPCYNSAAYMDHCIETILQGGEDIEIILVDDGSTKDDTPAICDRYAAEYPDIVKAIHQENGGHGEGVNQGIRNARGIYYKVVDSDDWLDTDALAKVMAKLREFAAMPAPVDLLIANYVYEHVEDNTQKVMGYKNVFPTDQIITWDSIHRFRASQYLLMHSVIYRTQLLRDCGLELPKHTFYVDNIFVYQPLPFVKTLYYMDLDLYRYFIGRADQSVNESVMAGRIDQQVRVTRHMIEAHDVLALKAVQPKLGRYMLGPNGCLVTKVLHFKHTYKEYVGVDACAANLMRPAMYGAYHHITVMGKEDRPCDHVYDVVGGLCENNDKFAIDRELPEIEIGDLLVIHDSGAHGFSMGYNYNGKLRSAELLLQADGTVKLIRRPETPEDYFATMLFD